MKRTNLKSIVLTLVVLLVLLGTSLIPACSGDSVIASDNSESDEKECLLCDVANDEDIVLFDDLTPEEQEGLIAMTLLYMRFEEEILSFDSLSYSEKTQYLNSYFEEYDGSIDPLSKSGEAQYINTHATPSQLVSLYDVVDEENKADLQLLFDVYEERDTPFDYVTNPPPTSGGLYEPGQCGTVLITTLSNMIPTVKDALAKLGVVIGAIGEVLTKVKEIRTKIRENIPNVGLLDVGKTGLFLGGVGLWYITHVRPIVKFIVRNPLTCAAIGIGVTFFTGWTALLFVHLFCKFILCGGPGAKQKNLVHTSNILSTLRSFFDSKTEKIRDLLTRIFSIVKPKTPNMQIQPLSDPPEWITLSCPGVLNKLFNGEEYKFLIKVKDSEGRNLPIITIDWDDGTTSTYEDVASEELIEVTHTWTVNEEITITGYAKDVDGDSSEKTKDYVVSGSKTRLRSYQQPTLFNNLNNLFTQLRYLLTA